jgi:hypothetical protein
MNACRRYMLFIAALGAVLMSTMSLAVAAEPVKSSFEGDWVFRSFLINAGPLDKVDPKVIEWAPVGDVHLEVSDDSKVTGKMTFRASGAELNISGKLLAVEKKGNPAGIELIAQGPGGMGRISEKVVYKITGWLVPNSPENYKYLPPAPMKLPQLEPVQDSKPSVRGTVMNVDSDLRGAAPWTVGAFVLIPKE